MLLHPQIDLLASSAFLLISSPALYLPLYPIFLKRFAIELAGNPLHPTYTCQLLIAQPFCLYSFCIGVYFAHFNSFVTSIISSSGIVSSIIILCFLSFEMMRMSGLRLYLAVLDKSLTLYSNCLFIIQLQASSSKFGINLEFSTCLFPSSLTNIIVLWVKI